MRSRVDGKGKLWGALHNLLCALSTASYGLYRVGQSAQGPVLFVFLSVFANSETLGDWKRPTLVSKAAWHASRAGLCVIRKQILDETLCNIELKIACIDSLHDLHHHTVGGHRKLVMRSWWKRAS